MPLIRLGEAYENELDGVWFCMSDENGRIQRCLASRVGLTDRIGGNPSEEERAEFFRNNRGEIERAASAKHDAGQFDRWGNIRIEAW